MNEYRFLVRAWTAKRLALGIFEASWKSVTVKMLGETKNQARVTLDHFISVRGDFFICAYEMTDKKIKGIRLKSACNKS